MDDSARFRRRQTWGTVIPLLLALVYDASPIDLIPDVIPILGWLDDGAATVLFIGIAIGQWRKWAKARKALSTSRSLVV